MQTSKGKNGGWGHQGSDPSAHTSLIWFIRPSPGPEAGQVPGVSRGPLGRHRLTLSMSQEAAGKATHPDTQGGLMCMARSGKSALGAPLRLVLSPNCTLGPRENLENAHACLLPLRCCSCGLDGAWPLAPEILWASGRSTCLGHHLWTKEGNRHGPLWGPFT